MAQVVKNPPSPVGDVGSVTRLGRCPGERNSNPLKHSCLENPMEEGAWQAAIPAVTKSRTQRSNLTTTIRGKPALVVNSSDYLRLVSKPLYYDWNFGPQAFQFQCTFLNILQSKDHSSASLWTLKCFIYVGHISTDHNERENWDCIVFIYY